MAKDDKREEIFKLDVTDFLGPDGRLSEDGRGRVRDALMAQFKERFPRASAEGMAARVEELLKETAELRPADLQIIVLGRSVVQVLQRALADTSTAGSSVANLAQLIDNAKSVSGPHVFECGSVSGGIEAARDLLVAAIGQLEAMLKCPCVGGGEHAGHAGKAAN